ncbi:MAG: ribosomal protein S18 acetylase RimI-like enzyme [Saprospiraceae bacterium]
MKEMSDISIRRATQEDLEVLLEFEQGIVVAERPYDETLAGDPISYYDIGELIQSAEAEVLVAYESSVIIASGYAKIENAKPYLSHDKYGYLGFMYVEPVFRGRGINKLIVDGLFSWLRSQNIQEVRLDVYDENLGAIRAYEKVGFERHLLNMRISI